MDKPVFKIIVAGEKNVGKTTLIKRYIAGSFIADTMTTIGVDFSLKTVQVGKDNQKEFMLQIWDIAGEERFRSILPNYISGSEGVILAFDSTDIETLEKLPGWINILNKHSDRELFFILISTKNDIINFNKSNRIKEIKNSYPQIKFYLPTSSKTGLNVAEIFKLAGNFIFKKYNL